MKSLVTASENRLQYSTQKSVALTEPASIMHRIAFIMLRLSPRPLIHLMKVWPIITSHFIQCACTREDEQLTRASIGCLNDCVSGLLISESNGFCFNQMLFYPFQDILCGDMCSEESQDQIVSLLASFVHARSDEIGSGWRPLFGALRALRTSPLNESDAINNGISSVQATVLDVFSTYLNIRNANILIATLLDYITCVLHYLQATESNFGENCQDFEVASTALKCLLKAESMMHELAIKGDSAVPHLLHRLVLRERVCENVDASVEPSYIVAPLSSVLLDDPFFDSTYHSPLPVDLDRIMQPSFDSFPWTSSGTVVKSCIELHLSLVEGLTAVAITCPASLQSRLLPTIADIISNLINSKFGIDYGSYTLSSLIFPVLQQWIRRETSDSEVNLKQAIGLFTEVTVTYINTSQDNPSIDRVLMDSLAVLSECSARCSERVARLGCACIRHLIKATANSFTQLRWTIVVRSLWNTVGLTLSYIRLLMRYYLVDSKDANGDVGRVRVIVSESSSTSTSTSHQISLLARQVFLLDNQIMQESTADKQKNECTQTFNQDLLLSENDADNIKLPIQQLVVSLLSHQLILQLIGCLLLQNVHLPVTGSAEMILNKINDSSQDNNKYLDKLCKEHVTTLFHCLDASLQVSRHFDSRPGLKSLIQSVFNFSSAPNLYKQCVLAWTLRSLTMYELVRTSASLDEKRINDLLSNGRCQEDHFIVWQLHSCHAKVCTFLCTVEKSLASEKISHLTRSHVVQQFSLKLDDTTEETLNDEKLYKVICSDEADALISNYKKAKKASSLNTHRRVNPFEGESKQEHDSQLSFYLNDGDVRCVAWTEMSLTMINLLLNENEEIFRRLSPIFYSNLVILLNGSTDIRVRKAIADLLIKLPSVYKMFTFHKPIS